MQLLLFLMDFLIRGQSHVRYVDEFNFIVPLHWIPSCSSLALTVYILGAVGCCSRGFRGLARGP